MLTKQVYMPLYWLLLLLVLFFIIGWSARTSWDSHHVKVQAVTIEPAK